MSVSDEGPGISEENQKRLFEGFFQVRPDQLQQGQGSGLGLSLCKQIVYLHGGTIGVDSAEGQGSTFHFTIVFKIPIADNCELRRISLDAPSVLPYRETPTTQLSSVAFNESIMPFDTISALNILVVDG